MPLPLMTNAQNSKNDEFYTQLKDIENEYGFIFYA